MSDSSGLLTGGFGAATIGPASTNISNEIKLPSVADINQQIADLNAKLAALPADISMQGLASHVLRSQYQNKIAALKQQLLGGVKTGLPPAPDAPGTFSTQIPTPKVGLDSLTIPL
jgi:hypothetical protein